MRIVFVEFDPGSLQRNVMRLREENGSTSAEVSFNWAGNLNPGQDDAYTTIRTAYENPDDPAKLIYVVADGLFAETPGDANSDPNAEPYPTREPEPWMMVQHPFTPRTTAWQVLTVDGWANMPITGSEYTVYDLRDGNHIQYLIWDAGASRYKTTTGSAPEHRDAHFDAHEEATPGTADVGSLVFTLDASIAATWEGWYIRLNVSANGRGTEIVGSNLDIGNTSIEFNLPDDMTWATAVTRINESVSSFGAPFEDLSVALADGADGTATVVVSSDTLSGGGHMAGGTYTLYQSTGATAGQPTTPIKLTFDPPSDPALGTEYIRLNADDRNRIRARQTFPAVVRLDGLEGVAANSATGAVWHDGTNPVEGQPSTYAFLLKLIHKRDTVETVLRQKRISGGSANPNLAATFATALEAERVSLQDSDEIYVTIEAESDSSADDPRSRSVEILAGNLVIAGYESEAAIDVDEQITWDRTVYLEQQLAQGTAIYREFDEPIPRADFPKLRYSIRFDRAEADFEPDEDYSMRDYTPLADRAAAEALAVSDAGRARITAAILNNVRGRLDVYRGSGFIGWDNENNLLCQLRQWFWGDDQFIRGVKSYLYYGETSSTNVYITERFER